MIVGHRWEYQPELLGYKCMPLPVGGVESIQWCVGCGCFIADLELCQSKLPIKESRELSLDMLADSKGYKPIEAGTFSEFKLRIGQHK